MIWFGRKKPLQGVDFVILASQRTGSNMLVSLLDAYPGVSCHGELFRQQRVNQKGALRVLKRLPPEFADGEYRAAEFADYLRRVRKLSPKNDYFGFKLMLNQAPQAREALIRDSGCRIVLLYRENLLAVYSSNLIAKATGQGNARVDQEVRTDKVEFVEKRFARFCEKHENTYRDVRRDLERHARERCLDISYLDICQAEGIGKIEQFLGVSKPPDPIAPATAKRNPSRIVDRFSNPELVLDYLERAGRSAWSHESFV